MSKNRDAVQDAALLEEIQTAAAKNEVGHAVDLARAALASGLVHPMLLNLRSHWWSQRGQSDRALADLRLAVSIAPADLLVRNALGILLGRLEKWSEAFEVLQDTATMAPNYAVAQFSLGWAYEATGELDKARGYFQAAAELDPGFVKPLVHLSSLAYRRSDWSSARELAERALALEPDQYTALTNLAIVALAEGDLDGSETLLRSLLARSAETPLDLALVQRTLGDLRHAQSRFAQAFSAYTNSNRQKYAVYAPRFETPGTTAADYCRWLANQFEGSQYAELRIKPRCEIEQSTEARGHVFLVGFPRSGTTLLENVLASHPDVSALEEKDTLGDLTRRFLVNTDGLDRLASLGADELREHRSAYWERVRKFGARVEGRYVVDKYPLTSMKLPLVAKLFPSAKILFAVRDPRDVVLSCFRRNFGMNTSMFEFLDMERAARFYDAVMSLSTIYKETLGQDWLQVHNESLISEFEVQVQKVCDFIGFEFSDRMRDFAEHAKRRTIKTPSSVQVVRGINSEGVGVWRNYAQQMTVALPVLQRWVETYGYSPA